jgi:hypothetical protein
MATEKEAELAREQHAEKLRKLGAHAIAVDEIKRRGGSTFVVVATFATKPGSVPKTLSVASGRKTVEVPLVVQRGPKFRPE